LEISSGWAVSIAKFGKGKYETKLEIQGEMGTKQVTILRSEVIDMEPHNTCVVFNRFCDAGLVANRRTT